MKSFMFWKNNQKKDTVVISEDIKACGLRVDHVKIKQIQDVVEKKQDITKLQKQNAIDSKLFEQKSVPLLEEDIDIPVHGDELMQKLAQTKVAIEQREKEELEQSEIHALLPSMYNNMRILPNPFLRSALFGVIKSGKRKFVKNHVVLSMSQYKLIYTGEQMDQNDLRVWDTITYIAKREQTKDQLRITIYQLLKELGLPNTGQYRKAILSRIERLRNGGVKIKSNSKTYFGGLINDGYIDENSDGKIVINFNKNLLAIFLSQDYTVLDNEIYTHLGKNQLSSWLYGFYKSHKEPKAYCIEQLRELSGSGASQKEFRRLLQESLTRLQKTICSGNNLSWRWKIDDNNRLIMDIR
jgi:ribosome-associated protein YbcJ (S4-like RNA binding protein)